MVGLGCDMDANCLEVSHYRSLVALKVPTAGMADHYPLEKRRPNPRLWHHEQGGSPCSPRTSIVYGKVVLVESEVRQVDCSCMTEFEIYTE